MYFNYRLSQIVLLCVFCLLSSNISAKTELIESPAICKQSGYTVSFFNNTWNSELNALAELYELKLRFNYETYNGQSLNYELFYTHLAGQVDTLYNIFSSDGSEIQNALFSRYELFGELFHGNSRSINSTIQKIIEHIDDINLKSTVNTLVAKTELMFIEQIAEKMMSANQPTIDFSESIYSVQRTRAEALLIEGEKVIFVAHSQGNNFANAAYKYTQRKFDLSGHIQQLHIAPMTTELNGDYILVDNDQLITIIRQNIAVMQANIAIPAAHLSTDFYGHNLVDTYLASNLATKGMTEELLRVSLDNARPISEVTNQGWLTVTMSWDGSGDVDLHLSEPSGRHVYHIYKEGISGYLDIDNIYGYGPEHYYTYCNENTVIPGIYKVGINNYHAAAGRTATVQVAIMEQGEIYSHNLDVGPVRGKITSWQKVIPVVEIEVIEKDNRYVAEIRSLIVSDSD